MAKRPYSVSKDVLKKAVKVTPAPIVVPEPVKEYSLMDMIADASAEIQFAREHGYSRATARRLAELEAQKEAELKLKLDSFHPGQLIWQNDIKVSIEDVAFTEMVEVDMAWSIQGISDGGHLVRAKLAFVIRDDGTKSKSIGYYPADYVTHFDPAALEKKVSSKGIIYWKFNK